MAEEHRITETLLKYWESKKDGRDFPEESDINSEEIEEIWDSCFLVQVLDGKFTYSFLGKSIIEAYGDNLEGEEVVENEIYPESPETTAKFAEIVQTKEANKFEGAFINRNNMDIKFRKTLMPLGRDGKVEYILGAMRWRSF